MHNTQVISSAFTGISHVGLSYLFDAWWQRKDKQRFEQLSDGQTAPDQLRQIVQGISGYSFERFKKLIKECKDTTTTEIMGIAEITVVSPDQDQETKSRDVIYNIKTQIKITLKRFDRW